jgi:hypothetical protein
MDAKEAWRLRWRYFRSIRSDLVAALRDRPQALMLLGNGDPDGAVKVSAYVRRARAAAQDRAGTVLVPRRSPLPSVVEGEVVAGRVVLSGRDASVDEVTS